MGKDRDDLLFKDRSSRACISAGYRLYMSNFKRIFRASWLAAIAFATVFSLGGTIMILSPQRGTIIFCTLILIETLFATYGFAVLSQHQETGCIGWTPCWYSLDTHIFVRTLKCWLCTLIINLLAGCLVGGVAAAAITYLSIYTAIGTIIFIGLLVFALLLPMTYTNTRYVLTDGIGYWRNLSGHYGIGLRRWGFIFIIVFVTILVEMLLSLFTSLPTSILSLANMQATIGATMGDPYAMPPYIGWLSAVVFLLIGFIQAYIFLSFLFPIYYMYGAIDTRENKKKEFNKTNNETHTLHRS